ncbi:MAG: hypothetical protein EPN20_16880 [Magnetospirillum sp.]|nr:MAG: hypothetical protein EPN20_16880 [Magnetospirillum sp.]
MMSPLSIAQYLPPGLVEFDLLLIDEASQVMPVDALGAMARARQAVVVGDTRQLPPTNFFARAAGDSRADEDDDEEDSATATIKAADAKSIRELCLAKGMPPRMLRWHYRSKHQSLIAVSNREFYDNKLYIVPSPYTAEAGMGLSFRHLPQAVYDAGNTRTNAVEAKAVAEAIIRHAKATPHLSLGVGTFSTAQRQAILDDLEHLRRLHPETEDFFNAGGAEPFFVKNLENIQGDERDVIFISVGYGRTKTGYIPMGFGPVSRDGGERRLNVLISRAKRRCEVFSGITDEDIDLARAKSRGAAALKAFLHFCRTGKLHMPVITMARRDRSPGQAHRPGALRRGAQAHGDRCRPCLRRLPRPPHRLVRDQAHSLSGRAGRHHQALHHRQGQRLQAGDGRRRPRPRSSTDRPQRSRRAGHRAECLSFGQRPDGFRERDLHRHHLSGPRSGSWRR